MMLPTFLPWPPFPLFVAFPWLAEALASHIAFVPLYVL